MSDGSSESLLAYMTHKDSLIVD